MAFRMVSENISDVQKAVSRELLDYSDLDQEVESVIETTNKVRGDISDLIREAKQGSSQSKAKSVSPVVWESDTPDTIPNMQVNHARYTPRGILSEWDQNQDEVYHQDPRGANNLFPRKCIICHRPHRNMKRHVISFHWWGVYGDLTCWYCRQYQTNTEISTCNGDFIPFTFTP